MSALSGAIEFMVQLGLYDVVLPFLLVFTLVFAMLEKTKVLGVDKIDGQSVPKQNLNSIVALVAGLLIVTSTQLVSAISSMLANAVLLVLLGVLFMMLLGSFSKDEEIHLSDGWKSLFTGIMFVGIVLIFLYSLGWLDGLWNLAQQGIDGTVMASIALLAVIVGGMYWVTGGSNGNGNKGEEK